MLHVNADFGEDGDRTVAVNLRGSAIVRPLIGPGHGLIHVFVACIEAMNRRLFERHIPMDDISATRDVYHQATEILGMKPHAVSINAKRMANLCWSAIFPQRLEEVIG